MSMMQAAANRLLQGYFEMLGKRGIRAAKSVDGVPYYEKDRNLSHIMWMCQECQAFTDTEKKNRWIGFIQGALWFAGLRTIEELKGEVINALEETRAFEALKHDTKHLREDQPLYCRMEGCREFVEYVSGRRTLYCHEHSPIPMEVKP